MKKKVYCGECGKYHCGMCMHYDNIRLVEIKGTWRDPPAMKRVERKKASTINKNNDCKWWCIDYTKLGN